MNFFNGYFSSRFYRKDLELGNLRIQVNSFLEDVLIKRGLIND